MSRIRLVIDSELHNVSLMAMAVNRICVSHGISEVDAYQIELCVSEAATNAIVHAFDRQPGNEVSLLLALESEGVMLECSDTGRSMTPEEVKRVTRKSIPPHPESASLREGGRGLHIIRGVMDEVSYTRHDGSNCLRMIKRFKL